MEQWSERLRLVDATGACAQSNSDLPAYAMFDRHEEIVWTWADEGKVVSYTAPDYASRYVSYKTPGGTLRQMLSDQDGLLSIASQARQQNKGVTHKAAVHTDESYDLVCGIASDSGVYYYIGGTQPNVLLYDSHSGNIVKEIPGDEGGAVVLRRGGRFICSASSSGSVCFCDPKSLNVEGRVQAHLGSISDMDMSGNYLVTCGYSERYGQYTCDPFVKVYDVRTFRPLAPVSYPPGAHFVRFHPRFSSTLFMVSQLGSFQLAEVGGGSGSMGFFQADFGGYACTSFDISSTGSLLAFGDSGGTVQLWSLTDEPQINMYSQPSEPLPEYQPLPSFDIDDNTPLNVVGVPYYSEQLFSYWPNKMSFKLPEHNAEIDESILSQVRQMGFVGYAPKPAGRHRNQVPATKSRIPADQERPRFRSEQERFLAKNKQASGPVASAASPGLTLPPTGQTPKTSQVPKHYKHVEIQYSKLGVEDFDFGFYNRTKFSGLETHIHNSYSNAILQALYFLPPFRQIMVEHVAHLHTKDHCLSCELGYLFRMLDNSGGFNCHSNNFLQAFRSIPQASALGLFEPEDPTSQTSYLHLVQNLSRFLLQHVQQETSATELKDLGIDDIANGSIEGLFSLKSTVIDHCTHCKKDISREGSSHVLEVFRSSGDVTNFETMLAGSLFKSVTTKAWCDNCKQYRLTIQSKQASRLPPILALNIMPPPVDIVNKEKVPESIILPVGFKVIPETAAAATPDAPTFKLKVRHPTTRVNLLQRFDEAAAASGDSSDASTDVIADPVDEADATTSSSGESPSDEYILVNMIAQIQNGNDRPHLVAHVRMPTGYHERNDTPKQDRFDWFLFNDFLVTPLSEHKVIQLAPWKVPASACFVRRDLWNAFAKKSDVAPKLESLEYLTETSPVNGKIGINITSALRASEMEQLGPKFLCAIDAEFVTTRAEESEVRADGSRGVIRPPRQVLARVSVVRGGINSEDSSAPSPQREPLFGKPFLDDYIVQTEPIIDYLTKFSGIKPGDLDPMSSMYTLTTLKSTYRKLCILIENGCTFVGHGLRQDFRIINIRVPREQVIDTVDLYHLQGQRKVSLKFLAWYLLKREIQTDMHSSVEDSQTALLLYWLYKDAQRQGRFGNMIEDVYDAGRQYNWTVPAPTATSLPASGPIAFGTL